MTSHLQTDQFTQKIEAARQRTEALKQHVRESPCGKTELMALSWAELQTALEELHVAEEELRQQNEELIATREAVEAERQRYQELFEFAPDGYLVTDANGKIWEANRAAASLFGVSQNYIVGKPLIVFVAEECRRSFRAHLTRLRNASGVQEWDVLLKRSGSKAFDAALTVAAVGDTRGNINLRWMIRDISARKEAEEKIRSYELENLQLVEITRLKSQFLALMSHELRTPMNAILGFSQLLLRQPQNQLGERQANMVERIFNSGKHLLTLIEDILNFSKLESGNLELNPEEFNLVETVTDTVEELRSLATQKHLEIHVKCDRDNISVVHDKIRLRQILINLLANAIKFTDVGEVWVEVYEVGPNKVAIAIRDTGIGIAESDLENIFMEFRQVNHFLTRDRSGTGLGLAIVDRLVRMMNGDISVESKLGVGSTFRVELPRKVRILNL